MISLSTVRVAWFVGIQCFRILISLSLLVGGTQFLLKTTSVNELLLNVVALEFIMSLDEVPHAIVCLCTVTKQVTPV